MSSETLWIDEKNIELWDKALPKNAYDVFYKKEYVRLYADDKNTAECFVYREDANIYFHPFIRSPVTQSPKYSDIQTPYGYGGPIATTDDPFFVKNALSEFYTQAKEKGVIAELLKFHPFQDNYSTIVQIFPGKIAKMRNVVWVDINIGEDFRLAKIYPHANRKNINKSVRAGCKIKFGQSEEQWKAYLDLYRQTMEANKASSFYYFDEKYYSDIRKNLAENYVLVSAEIEGTPQSVLLVLFSKNAAYCHLIGSSGTAMKLGVNNQLHHELILWCKEQGIPKLMIGGGRTNDDEDGLLKFKKNFSDRTEAFYVGEYVLNQAIYDQVCREWLERNPEHATETKFLKYRL